MSGPGRRFRYRLEALAKLRSAERDALKGEVGKAIEKAEAIERESKALAAGIERAESELRSQRSSGADLSLDVQLRLQRYLVQQRELHGRKQTELEDASRVVLRGMADLQQKVQDGKALENHRARTQRQFDAQEARASLNEADESWLQHKRRG